MNTFVFVSNLMKKSVRLHNVESITDISGRFYFGPLLWRQEVIPGGWCSSSSGSCCGSCTTSRYSWLLWGCTVYVSECRPHTRIYMQACIESRIDWSHKVKDNEWIRVEGRGLRGGVGSNFHCLTIEKKRIDCMNMSPDRINLLGCIIKDR